MTPVWIRTHRQWCVLRYADPSGCISTLCLDSYERPTGLMLRTTDPGADACTACRNEIRAGTQGAAVAVGRVKTRDLRPPVEVEIEEWGP